MRHRMRTAALVALVLTVLVIETRADEPKIPEMPQAFSSFGAAASDGYVYVYGGHTSKTHSYSTETATPKFRRLSISNPQSGWEELAPGVGLQGLALVAHNGKIYRIGGMQPRNKPGDKADNHSVESVGVYDTKAGKWNDFVPLPAGRSSHDAVVVGDKLFVMGGWDMKGAGNGNPFHETALVMDLSAASPEWKSIPQPFKRRALNVAAAGGKIFVVGGMNWENEIEKTVDVYDVASGKWTSAPILPGPIMNGFTPAACAQGGSVFASPSDGKVYRLDGEKWIEVASLADKRLVHRMVPFGDTKLAVMGGASKGANHSSVEVFTPTVAAAPAVKKADAGTQVFCPIMTTTPVDEESREVEYNGVKIKICCSTCAKKFKAEPEAYLNVALLPQIKDMKLPERKIQQVFCPVFPDRVVSSKDPSAQYNGATIYFFSETAKARFLADPARYADAKILPQLQSR